MKTVTPGTVSTVRHRSGAKSDSLPVRVPALGGRRRPDLEVHHECGNPACINIRHLKAITHDLNIAIGDPRYSQSTDPCQAKTRGRVTGIPCVVHLNH
jgi:hypothetical protein